MAKTKTLDQFRRERFLSVVEFADYLDITVVTYYRLIRGKPAHYSTMRKIAAKLGVSPGDISEFAPKQTGTATADGDKE